jgi:pimeloyl-ACP methyl ester carboxylesterase
MEQRNRMFAKQQKRVIPATLLLFSLLLLAGCASVTTDAELFMEDVVAGRSASTLKVATERPKRRTVRFEVEGRRYLGDLYRPGSQPTAAILLVPGVTEEGRGDARLVAFASTLARSRFLVLVPEIPGLRELKVRPADIRAVADTFAHLHSLAPPEIRGRVGIGAFSYAVGPSLLAALEPEIKHCVSFLVSVGGYHDLHRLITFLTTGHYTENGMRRALAPNPYGKWLFLRANLDRVKSVRDRSLLKKIASRKLKAPDLSVEKLAAGLGSEGKAIYALVVNRDPERTPDLFSRLPRGLQADMAALSPAQRNLAEMEADVILVHGRHDPIIPYTESLSLVGALPEYKTRLYLVEGLSHVDFRIGLLDRLTLRGAVSALLSYRLSAGQEIKGDIESCR